MQAMASSTAMATHVGRGSSGAASLPVTSSTVCRVSMASGSSSQNRERDRDRPRDRDRDRDRRDDRRPPDDEPPGPDEF